MAHRMGVPWDGLPRRDPDSAAPPPMRRPLDGSRRILSSEWGESGVEQGLCGDIELQPHSRAAPGTQVNSEVCAAVRNAPDRTGANVRQCSRQLACDSAAGAAQSSNLTGVPSGLRPRPR